jgi:hypothetical protein
MLTGAGFIGVYIPLVRTRAGKAIAEIVCNQHSNDGYKGRILRLKSLLYLKQHY